MATKKTPEKSSRQKLKGNRGLKKRNQWWPKKRDYTAISGKIYVVNEDKMDLANAERSLIEIISKDVKENVFSITYDWNDDSRAYNLLTAIREGFDYNTFDIIAKNSPLDDRDWAVVLDTTTRTLERYKKDNRVFGSSQTEKIIEVQQLMQYGVEVFGNVNNFYAWLVRENIALGHIIPKDLLDTSLGIGLVKDALGRIEHGILA